LKILQVSNFFKPCWDAGGVARSCYEISKELSNKGHEVTVFTTNYSTTEKGVPTNKLVNLEEMRVYYFENLRKCFPVKTPPLPYYLPFVAKKEIKNFDIIHIHEHRTNLAVIVSYYARKYDIPYIVQPRGSAQKVNKSLQKTFFDRVVGYKILRNAEKILMSSKNEYQLSRSILNRAKMDEKDISYTPNGINLAEVLAGSNDFRKIYGVSDEEKLILYLGRISKRKGLDMLFEAFKDIMGKENNCRLMIVGPDSPYAKDLKSKVQRSKLKDNILMPGPLYDEDKYSAYSAADVFVLPSNDQQESFGNVVLEASVCGTPCVATNVCGVTEWMENVIKVDPDVKSIKAGIEKGLKSSTLGDKARKEVVESLGWDSIVENDLVPVYEDII